MLENSENFQKQSRKLYALLKLEQSLQKREESRKKMIENVQL